MLYWLLKRLLVEPVLRVATRPWIEGAEHLPAEGPALLVSNHLHASETIMVPGLLPRRLVFLAKAELFTAKGPGSLFVAVMLRALGMLPLDRSGGQASSNSLAPLQERLGRGEVVCVFPEGSRSADGRLYKGRTGVARMVLAANAGARFVPVIPIGVVNTVPRRTRLGVPWISRPGIRIGRPLDFREYVGAGNDRDTLRWITDEIMNAIMELSGQTYVDVYSSSFKQALAAGSAIQAPTPARPGLGRPAPPPPVLAPVVERDPDAA